MPIRHNMVIILQHIKIWSHYPVHLKWTLCDTWIIPQSKRGKGGGKQDGVTQVKSRRWYECFSLLGQEKPLSERRRQEAPFSPGIQLLKETTWPWFVGKFPQELALSLPLNFVCLTALYLPPLNYGVYFKTLAFLEITSKEEGNYLTEWDDYMLMTDDPSG